MRKYLKEEEIKSVFDQTKNPRDYLILRLLYETGMRVGELADLKIRDIDLQESEISIQKAKRHKEGRKIPIWNNSTSNMLEMYIGTRDRDEGLFISNKGTPISKRQIQRIYEDCAKRAGIERERQHVHILRHTHAVMALKSGVDLRTLQMNLGHSKIDITAIYLTLDISERKEVYSKNPLPSA
jgi:integrase/recombinase XerD